MPSSRQDPPPLGHALAHPVGCWLRANAPAGADLQVDSRRIARGDVFVALPGRHSPVGAHLASAVERGAAALLVDEQSWAAELPPPAAAGLPCLPVAQLGRALGPIAADYYDAPTAQLRTIGITGTNGKTSSCLWLAQVLATAGQPCATLGTLGFGFPAALRTDASALTTPDAATVQRLARAALAQGARALAMEVSSIGLEQGRVDGVHFEVALFTNLSRDHLDYHRDMAAYAAAKRRLFHWPQLRHAVLNLDDALGRELAHELAHAPGAGGAPAVTGCSTQAGAAGAAGLDSVLRAEHVQHSAQGLRFDLVREHAGGRRSVPVAAGLLGAFNLANLLGVIGAALACGVDLEIAARAAGTLQAPPGRLQRVPAHGAAAPLAVVDYAHTPDAIAQALAALRPVACQGGGRLWIVFGAGGDRDRGKRPAMGAAAAAAADVIVLTSDNPRSESPATILDEIAAGIPAATPFERQADRAAAIRMALHAAAAHDVVLIAGKGHEDYQEIGGRRLPFSDLAEAQAALRERTAGAGTRTRP